jgi:hypothetical protein
MEYGIWNMEYGMRDGAFLRILYSIFRIPFSP